MHRTACAQSPYGVGDPPEKVKTADAAVFASTGAGHNHYEAPLLPLT